MERPRRPNIIVLVIDTLREDHAGGLEALRDLGFIKYENAIAPAPWTLPSHVSMVTGLYPSQHGVHEAYGVYAGTMMGPSRQRMSKLNRGIIGELMKEGYSAYVISANPFISAAYGFGGVTEGLVVEDRCRRHKECSDYERLATALSRHKGYLGAALELIRDRELRLLLSGVKLLARSRLWRLANRLGLYDPTMEKGSLAILDFLRGRSFEEPFFMLINIMEAHGPYTVKDMKMSMRLTVRAFLEAVFFNRLDEEVVNLNRQNYPRHAAYATGRALEIVHALKGYLDRSLVIVTSDHGELLGDGGINHGYFLKDGLLRVPLWVRWPSWARPVKQEGAFVSLAQVPSIVRAAIGGETSSLGSDVVLAESFGPPDRPESVYRKGELPKEALERAFSHRVRVYSRRGSATYNFTTGELEEVSGDVQELTKVVRDVASGLAH
ncbi:MAG: sulfatase-like hydrolase/transferase [Acidilobus sp.]